MFRIADRQGILTGKSLSAVQRFGIRVMLFLEKKEHMEGELRALKLSLMAPSPFELAPELFPDYFRSEDFGSVEEETGIVVTNSIKEEEVDEFLAMMGIEGRRG